MQVFLNAAKQRQVEMDTKTFRCALYQPTDTQYMALGNEYYPPMTRANQSVIDAYLGGLGEQCPVVRACARTRVHGRKGARMHPCASGAAH